MAVEGGGGSSESGMELLRYEKLRHMVLADDPEGLRVASVHWASMYKELEDRVNTIEIAIHRLSKVWHGSGGRTALAKYRQALEVMQSAMWTAKSNAENIGDAYDAVVKAQKAMRELDATPNKANETPNPQPGGTEPYAWDLDSRQPAAYEIAKSLSYSYAWAGAGYSPLSYDGDDRIIGRDKSADGDTSAGSGGTPTNGARSTSGGSQTGSGNGSPGALTPGPGSLAGPGSGPAPRGSQTPSHRVRAPAVGPQPAVGPGRVPRGSSGFDVPAGAPGSPSSVAADQGRFGASGRAGVGRGSVRFGGGDLGGKTLGGGTRPTAVPVEPAIPPAQPGVGNPGETGPVPPGGGVPGASGGGGDGGRRGRRKPGYEQGEPEMFVDNRQANAAGGTIRQPSAAKSFDPTPGMLGSQKHKPTAEDDHSQWELPATSPTPEGFPDKVEDSKFTRRDGVQFEVRRRKGGA